MHVRKVTAQCFLLLPLLRFLRASVWKDGNVMTSNEADVGRWKEIEFFVEFGVVELLCALQKEEEG